MPREIEFRDTPADGFPAPPGAEITRSMPVQGSALRDLTHCQETVEALRFAARRKTVERKQAVEDDNNMDRGK